MKISIVGGAGFIGSHLSRFLLKLGNHVTVIDNLSSGTVGHVGDLINSHHFKLEKFDARDTERLSRTFHRCDYVFHLASNPDIAKAATEPRIDFTDGTLITESVLEAVRLAGVRGIIYASGSGVYGDTGDIEVTEDHPLRPISTYGASKLAGESLIRAYSEMFGIQGRVYRFANVVGPRQTHGVAFDFINRLKINPELLEVRGNGFQNKPYIHVKDVITGILHGMEKSTQTFDVFNVSVDDQLSVREIVDLVLKEMQISYSSVKVVFGEDHRGWKGDVPVIKLSAKRLIALGWNPSMNSRSALESAIESLVKEVWWKP